MLSPEAFEPIADAIQAAMGVPGRISAVGNKLTWTPGGVSLEPSVTVHAKDGHTSIRYVETLANRGELKAGVGVIAGLSVIGTGAVVLLAGAAIGKAADVSRASGVPVVLGIAAVLGIFAAIGSIFGVKRSFARRLESRSRFADEALVRVSAAVKTSLGASPIRARVETHEAKHVEPPSEIEQAEAEAAKAEVAEAKARTREHRS
jgi:hypothetical protein